MPLARKIKMSKTRIEQKFEELKATGKSAFIPYITAGDPSLKDTKDIVFRLEDAGCDIIEIGIPFSDPLADGVANQLAAERGLASGTTLNGVLDLVAEIRERSEIPIVIYTYMNPLYAPGFDRIVKRAAKVGVDGLLIVDLSVVEAPPYQEILKKHGLNSISLVTPTTPTNRIAEIAKGGSGFIYTVSRTGVTGAQAEVQQDALALLKRVKRHSKLPVALGFGVSTPEQAATYAKLSDAVVVGSYIVNLLHKAGPRKRAAAVREIKKMVDAVKEV